jgi:two-component system response regulator
MKIMTDPYADLLLIEDDPDEVRLTLRVFEAANLGNTLHVARDGVEALAFLSNADMRHPKLILLDWASPKLDGSKFLERIKCNPDTSWIPVIVLASSIRERDAVWASETRADGCIVRPFDFERFMEALHKIGRLWLEVDQTEAA